MRASELIGLALLVFMALAVGAVVVDFVRRRRVAGQAKRAAAEVERQAAQQVGWWVLRGTAVYQIATEDEFVAACRDGRVYPTDQVYALGQWRKAIEIREPKLAFSAEAIQRSWPPSPSFGCFALVLFVWLMSVIENLTKPLSKIMDPDSASLITAVAQLVALAGGIYLARRSFLPRNA